MHEGTVVPPLSEDGLMAVKKEDLIDGTPREPLARVGVRELKEHTSEVVRRVREDHETVDITYRGEVVARIVPVQTKPPFDREAFERRWAEHEEFARYISDGWPEGVTAVDAIRDVRE